MGVQLQCLGQKDRQRPSEKRRSFRRLEEETRFVWDGRYTYFYTDPDSYEPLAQVRNWTTEEGESHQQTHYFHCDQIDIPREIADKDGNLVWGLLWLGQTEERNQRNGCPRIPLKDIQPDPIDWW